MARANVNQIVQIAPEGGSPGVQTAGTKRLVSTMVDIAAKSDGQEFTPSGYRVPTVFTQGKEWTEFDWTQTGNYNEVVYPLTGAFGSAVITTPAGGTLSRQWQFTPPSFGDTPNKQTFSFEKGDSTTAEKFPYGTFQGFEVDWDRTKITFKGKGFGALLAVAAQTLTASGVSEQQVLTETGAPTGGTFTATFGAQTTSALAYNVTAAAFQTAFQTLTSVGVGNVVCIGGPINTAPIQVFFVGTLGATNVATIAVTPTLTGGTAPTVTVATTTQGAAGVVEIPMMPFIPKQMQFYVDDTYNAIGTSLMQSAYAGNLVIGDRYDMTWPVNSTLTSFKDVVEKANTATSTVTLEADATGKSFFTNLRANTKKFCRLKGVGPIIEGAITYSITIDFCAYIKTPNKFADTNHVYALPWDFQVAHDSSFLGSGGFVQITVVNPLTAL